MFSHVKPTAQAGNAENAGNDSAKTKIARVFPAELRVLASSCWE